MSRSLTKCRGLCFCPHFDKRPNIQPLSALLVQNVLNAATHCNFTTFSRCSISIRIFLILHIRSSTIDTDEHHESAIRQREMNRKNGLNIRRRVDTSATNFLRHLCCAPETPAQGPPLIACAPSSASLYGAVRAPRAPAVLYLAALAEAA